MADIEKNLLKVLKIKNSKLYSTLFQGSRQNEFRISSLLQTLLFSA
jgi:hypothetical protein